MNKETAGVLFDHGSRLATGFFLIAAAAVLSGSVVLILHTWPKVVWVLLAGAACYLVGWVIDRE